MKKTLKTTGISAAALSALMLLAACGSSTTSSTPSATVTVSESPTATASDTASASSTVSTDKKMTLETDKGNVVIALDSNAANTVAHLEKVNASGYWKPHTCHRLTTQPAVAAEGFYVLQCGDPSGTGTGGSTIAPIAEENLPASDMYKRGVVAMANTGAPGSTDSQFFIVYKDSPLPANYTIIGNVVEGQNIVDETAAGGVVGGSSDGKPKTPFKIEKIVIN